MPLDLQSTCWTPFTTTCDSCHHILLLPTTPWLRIKWEVEIKQQKMVCCDWPFTAYSTFTVYVYKLLVLIRAIFVTNKLVFKNSVDKYLVFISFASMKLSVHLVLIRVQCDKNEEWRCICHYILKYLCLPLSS